jgi:hypothetical protein
MSINEESLKAIADLSLYLKNISGEEMYLSDMPKLIPLRWQFFRDNWEFIRNDIVSRMAEYNDPALLKNHIDEFDNFITVQRSGRVRGNPLSATSSFYRFYAIFDNILIDDVDISNAEEEVIEQEINRVSNFSKKNFENIRDTLEAQRNIMADVIGLSDETFNAATNRGPVPSQVQPTISEMIRMQRVQDAIRSVEFVLANSFSLTSTFLDPFAYARANANNPEIDIASYQSGELVRLNYGENLQLLARRYLGDPDRWIDIAIANGLKPPYIDEVGVRLSLISNAEGNRINIPRVDSQGNLNIDRFYINQIVLLQSDTQNFPENRRIIDIYEVPISGEIILELDGTPDLERYRIDEDAHIRIFKPNTINSNFFILIPSQQPLTADREAETPFFLQGRAEDEKRQKVDLALSDTNDLIFTANSDLRLSFGIENAVQAIKLKMQTKLGELRRHPDFGLADVTGQKNVDKDAIKEVLIESISDQINRDPRFDRVESLSVVYGVPDTANAPSVYIIQLQVRLAGSEQVIPISFDVAG